MQATATWKVLYVSTARAWGRLPDHDCDDDDDDDSRDRNRCCRLIDRCSNVTTLGLSHSLLKLYILSTKETVQSTSSHLPFFLWTFRLDTMAVGNHMSNDFMVDDFNIRHSSQRGYMLESFNSQWSRGPLNQYGVLQQNGCVPWKPCRLQCNLIQPLGQASLNKNGKKYVRNRGLREQMNCVTLR